MIGSLIGTIKLPRLFAILWGAIFGGYPFIAIVLPSLDQDIMYLVAYIIGIISVVVLILFIKLMSKRNKFGNEILGKIMGFRHFLEIAQKPQLEALVNENPEYFYNILPYTYALGVSKVWMSKFETIAIKAPDWYVGYSEFNMHDFNDFMDNTMQKIENDISASGGSSSGGSSSGGGSGGGGGGSW